jgi:Uma2 family endonuclease
MAALSLPKMTVDEYLAWAEGRPGRYELYDGQIFQMAPERAQHASLKLRCRQHWLARSAVLGWIAICCPTA